MRNPARLALSVAALCVGSGITTTHAQCWDWSSAYGVGGLSSAGLAQVVFDDGNGAELYVGGQFTIAGNVIANGIAKWNGSRWAALGSGIDAPPMLPVQGGMGLINALAVYDDGSGAALYAGGIFTSIGGVAANNVAKWNGTGWSPLGSGANQEVRALIAFDDGSGPALYAGGRFNSAGGVATNGVARWNGGAWAAVGSLCTNPTVHAFEIFDDGGGAALYAGGLFCWGQSPKAVAKWNGSSWAALAGGRDAEIFALEVYDDGSGPALFAGGNEIPFGIVNPQKLSKWDGASWTTLAGYAGGVRGLTVFDDGGGDALYITGPIVYAGIQTVIRWDGAINSFVGASSGLTKTSCCGPVGASLGVFDDGSGAGPGLYCSGIFNRADGNFAINFARYDAQGWSAPTVGVAPDAFVHALHTFDDGNGNALYVGGGFGNIGNVNARSAARRIGGSWQGLSLPGAAYIYALTDHDDGSGRALYAGGYISGYDGVARWTGGGWAPLDVGVDGTILALATYDDGAGEALFAIGNLTAAGGSPTRNISMWRGGAWSSIGGLGDEGYCGTSFDDGSGSKLFVGGRFTSAGGVSAPHVASWNGSTWADVGGGTNGRVYALGIHDDGSGPALYAGGAFTTAGAASALNVAKWNGSTWSAVGGGLVVPVGRFTVHDDGTGSKLYASAYGGEHLYRWNGTTWTDIGAFDGQIRGLASFDDGSGPSLFVGGVFVTVDDRASHYLAQWGRACTCAPVGYCTAGTTSNGCAAHVSATGTASASSNSGFDLLVSGIDGQRNGSIFYGLSGPLAAPWHSGPSFLCVKSPQQRTGTQFSGGTNGVCDGTFALDFNTYLSTHPAALGQPFIAVTSAWAQAWFRDPSAPAGTSLSDALTFDVCP